MSEISRGRRHVFSAITVVALLVTVEVALRLLPAGWLHGANDGSNGFAGTVDPFQVDGDRIVLRPGSHRTFNPLSLERTRSPGSIRVVVLGGSSTFGFPYGDPVSHPRFLAHRLAALFPGRTVEVANLGGMSYGSQRIEGLLPWVRRLAPDLVVIDTGHNEFVESAAYQRALGDVPWLGALRMRLSSSRLYGLLSGALGGLHARLGSGQPQGGLFGLDVSRDESRLFTLEEKERVAAAFHDRMQRIAAGFRRAGTPLLLVTTPSNLRDWKPETLAFVYPLPRDRQKEFVGHLGLGIRALESQRPADALTELDAAMAIDDRHAMTVFHRARALEALGRDEYVAAYARARDLDPVPIRALSAMTAAIRDVATSTGTPWSDVEGAFAAAATGHVPGADLFVDYCHLSDGGARLFADVVARSIVEQRLLPGLPPDATQRLAAYEPHDESAPPLEQLSAPILWWLGTASLRQGRSDEAQARFELGLAKDPDEHRILRALIPIYEANAEPDRARPLAERLASSPDATLDDQVAVASLDLELGRVAEARQRLDALVERGARSASVERHRAQVELTAGDKERARKHLEAALEIRPEDFRVRKELGDVCREQGDRECAVRAYREVLAQVNYMPSVQRALDEMGGPP